MRRKRKKKRRRIKYRSRNPEKRKKTVSEKTTKQKNIEPEQLLINQT